MAEEPRFVWLMYGEGYFCYTLIAAVLISINGRAENVHYPEQSGFSSATLKTEWSVSARVFCFSGDQRR